MLCTYSTQHTCGMMLCDIEIKYFVLFSSNLNPILEAIGFFPAAAILWVLSLCVTNELDFMHPIIRKSPCTVQLLRKHGNFSNNDLSHYFNGNSDMSH